VIHGDPRTEDFLAGDLYFPEEALPGRSEPAYEIENRHAVLGTP
jgi:hypothetical protein